MARLVAISVLCQDAIDDSLEVLLPWSEKTYVDSFIAIKQWAISTKDEMVEDLEPAYIPPHDPVKDACHDAIAAAMRRDEPAYQAARQREAEARELAEASG